MVLIGTDRKTFYRWVGLELHMDCVNAKKKKTLRGYWSDNLTMGIERHVG